MCPVILNVVRLQKTLSVKSASYAEDIPRSYGVDLMNVKYKLFQGMVKEWETLVDQAAEFASLLDPEKLISISQGTSSLDVSVITVWYWE